MAASVDAIRAQTHQPQTNVTTFTASVLQQPQAFALEEVVLPSPAADEILVRMEGCGVCASNLPVWEGRDWFNYPLAPGAPGHEGWGRVITCGAEVKTLAPGMRVACLGANAFSQLALVKAAEAVELPPALDGKPFPGEAIACAMNIFRRADVQHGQHVAVIGAGFLGLLLVQLAVQKGAQVVVLSRRAEVRERAMHYGAQAALDTEDWWGNAERLRERTGGVGYQRVIEVTGLQFALDAATALIAEYGKLIIGGYHQDGPRQINMQQWNWNAIDVINAHERDPARYIQGLRDAIEATIAGRIKPFELLTHRFHLAELDRAFAMMHERPSGFIKAWIDLQKE